MSWIKRLLGFEAAQQVVSLADKHAKASRLAQDALNLFDGIVADLRESANGLSAVAAEAKAEAQALLTRADSASQEAAKHSARADKIAALVE